ncbi:MAG: EAL domain-containing protein [Pseudomonadota bacterium]
MATLNEQQLEDGDIGELRDAMKAMRDELDLIYHVDEKVAHEPHGQARLSRLLGELTRFLNMSYTVLLIPSKHIRISITHSNWKPVDRRKLDATMLRQLFPKYSTYNKPVLLEMQSPPSGARGRVDPYQLILYPVMDRSGDAVGVLATFCQVEGKPLSVSAERLVRYVGRFAKRIIDDSYDQLTGLMRRNDFVSVMDSSIDELQDVQDTHCLVYFDVDQLTVFNDTFDQRAGDEVLVRVANLLQSEMPTGATLARIGGDKFAVLLRYRDVEAGVAFAERVRGQSQKLLYARGKKTFPVTLSAGVVALNDYESSEESPLIVARMACEKAKDHGGDRVECFDSADKSIVRRVDNLQLFAQLQEAITNEAFTLDAQPIVPLVSDVGSVHYEILLRMNGPSGDVMLPEKFFAAAEHYQMMPRIDRFVIQSFFESVGRHMDTMALHEASFALNLSGQSLGEPAFHEFVRQAVLNGSLSPEQICFEITETAAIANREGAIAFMNTMRELGCRFALDDFGAGLSSFAYLRDLPVDILKIDGSFVRDMDTNKVSESMVAASAQVARVMGLKTVAEFVETEAVRDGLAQLGVDYGQGFLLGKPKPLDARLEALSEGTNSGMLNLTGLLEAERTNTGTLG